MPVNITLLAADLSGRHLGTGYSAEEIADALIAEGVSVGVVIKAGP